MASSVVSLSQTVSKQSTKPCSWLYDYPSLTFQPGHILFKKQSGFFHHTTHFSKLLETSCLKSRLLLRHHKMHLHNVLSGQVWHISNKVLPYFPPLNSNSTWARWALHRWAEINWTSDDISLIGFGKKHTICFIRNNSINADLWNPFHSPNSFNFSKYSAFSIFTFPTQVFWLCLLCTTNLEQTSSKLQNNWNTEFL